MNTVTFHRYGVLLFEMLTGDLPYYHKNKKKMIDSIKIAKKPKFPKFARLAICSSLAAQRKTFTCQIRMKRLATTASTALPVLKLKKLLG